MKRLLILMFAALLVAGCASPPPHSYVIKRGGYLEEKDYAAFRKLADQLPPIPLPKEWPNLFATWSYYVETNHDFRTFDGIGIPDLEAWDKAAGGLTKSIADQLAKELLRRKLVKEVDRSNTGTPLAFVGAVTRFKKGSAVAGSVGISGPPSQDFVQTEFKVMVNGKPAGAIQVHAVRALGLGPNLIGHLVAGKLEGQIAAGVAEALKGMKANIPAKAAGGYVDWFGE